MHHHNEVVWSEKSINRASENDANFRRPKTTRSNRILFQTGYADTVLASENDAVFRRLKTTPDLASENDALN